MIQIERTVCADRPHERVFEYLLDFANADDWDAGTLSCTRQAGDGGVGTTYRNTSRFLGRTTTLIYEVQRVDPPTGFTIVGRNQTVTSTDTIVVAAEGPARTRVTYRAAFEFHGAASWAEPLLRLPVRRLADRTERSLAEALARLPE